MTTSKHGNKAVGVSASRKLGGVDWGAIVGDKRNEAFLVYYDGAPRWVTASDLSFYSAFQRSIDSAVNPVEARVQALEASTGWDKIFDDEWNNLAGPPNLIKEIPLQDTTDHHHRISFEGWWSNAQPMMQVEGGSLTGAYIEGQLTDGSEWKVDLEHDMTYGAYHVPEIDLHKPWVCRLDMVRTPAGYTAARWVGIIEFDGKKADGTDAMLRGEISLPPSDWRRLMIGSNRSADKGYTSMVCMGVK